MTVAYKTGIGYDVHRLIDGKELILGGISIPYIKGLEGHSDADVLLHAICDALLGAIANGDIGEHFPDSDEKYRGISSIVLLQEVNKMVKESGFFIGNIDTIVIADEPRLTPFKQKMCKKIAEVLGIDESIVNVKAKTQERLEAGGQQAIYSYATVLLSKGV